ncbi:hypothetical protein Hanom_Chr06g00534021 [Helianthus anomalus]
MVLLVNIIVIKCVRRTQRRISKIFVTNLPEGCRGVDLACHVRVFGQIYDLYITRKRYSWLWWSMARFVLEDGEINSNNKVEGHHDTDNMRHSTQREEVNMESKSFTFEKGDRSFKDRHVGKFVKINGRVDAFCILHGRALIASMVGLESLKNIKVIMKDFCSSIIKVQYLGGLDLLIRFEDEEATSIVYHATLNMVDTFSRISVWDGNSDGFEHLAWLKVQGIPLHLIANEVIDVVGGFFAKVVHKVLVGDGKRVSEEVVLNWKDRKFQSGGTR